ncbi:hypothetical protein VTK56DRAFT_1039 [Thermocarpiscus australiensis]
MSKDTKDPKHRPDSLRQPQRKDSLSSVLSWAALQSKLAAPKPPTTPASAPQSPQTSRPRRHSHGSGTDIKKKTPPMNLDSKASAGSPKAGKNGFSENVHKTAPDAPDAGKNTSQNHSAPTAQNKPRSPEPPPSPMPKSILRVSSPDGHRRPRQFFDPNTGEPSSPGLTPSSPVFTSMPPDSPPGSPPMSPIQRPMSPGATVRFAKATIHRVEVGPGRRFLPVKRKSKSTLTYISPLDPGTQQSAPKTMLQSPTKLRRHQENQAAMGRYWLRTEEEEAQWRAEAERRAAEEAERYRNEPASPVPVAVVARSSVEAVGVPSTLAEKVATIDKLPPLDSAPARDKLEEVEADSSDSDTDEEAGAKCNQETTIEELVTAKESPAGLKSGGDRLGIVKVEVREVAEEKPAAEKPMEVKPMPLATGQAKGSASNSNSAAAVAAAEEPAAKAATTPTASPTSVATPTLTAEEARLSEARSYYERLAERQAAVERAMRRAATPVETADGPGVSKADSSESRRGKSDADKSTLSFGSSSKEKLEPARSNNSEGGSGSGSGPRSAEHLERSQAQDKDKGRAKENGNEKERNKEKEREREKEKEREREREKSKDKPGAVSPVKPGAVSPVKPAVTLKSGGVAARAEKTMMAFRANHNHNHSTNHLHLSGRRSRRYFDDPKQEITA